MIKITPLTTKDGYRIENDDVAVNILVGGKVSVATQGYMKNEDEFIRKYLECQKALDEYIKEELAEIVR